MERFGDFRAPINAGSRPPVCGGINDGRPDADIGHWMLESTSLEDVPTHRVVVMPDRRRSAGCAVFFGVLTLIVAARGITSHSVTELVIALLVFGSLFGFFASWAARRRPALVLDGDALTDGRSGRVIPWAIVRTLHVGIGRGPFGETHHLVLTLDNDGSKRRQFITTNANNPNEVDIDLDLLSAPWNDVVSLVEHASGRDVARVHDRY